MFSFVESGTCDGGCRLGFQMSMSSQQVPSATRLPRGNGWIPGPGRGDLSRPKAVFVQGTGLCLVVGETERGSQSQLHIRIPGVLSKHLKAQAISRSVKSESPGLGHRHGYF